MSYILDALKKADADRERDTAGVPDLHAQADTATGALRRSRPGRGLLWAAVASITIAVLAWQWFDTAPTDMTPPLSSTSQTAPAPMPMAPVATLSPPAPQPVAQPDTAPQPGPPAVAPDPAPIPSLAAKPEAMPRPPAREATATPGTPPPRGTTAPSPATPAAAEPRVPRLAELPADVRSKLPTLVVGGSMYSPNARSRMVILNGQVFREGDKLAEGLSVESIGLKSTVLAFRGVRFELNH